MGGSESISVIKKGDFLINENDIQSGKSGKYQIKSILGQGGFGKVVKCIKLDTKEEIAVKIVKNRDDWVGRREVAILKKLRELDQDRSNLVKFAEHFRYKGCMCLAFELLDLSISQFIKKRKFSSLHLSEIQVITQQMLVAVKALRSIGVVHTDIKPDNVMLVNHKSQPLRIKLIDFGLACPIKKLKKTKTVQAICYRAPEVFLGLPLNEAIDMWGLGCVVAYMYIGQKLHVGKSASEVMRVITQIHGQPEDHLLDSGVKTTLYFEKDTYSPSASWRPRTSDDVLCVTSPTCSQSITSIVFTSLDDLTKARPKAKNRFEREDTKAFLSFLKHVLQLDAAKRMTASQALRHRFITMRHFSSNPKAKAYSSSDRLMTKNSQLEETTVEHSITSSKVVKCKALINSPDVPCSAGTSKVPVTLKRLNNICTTGRNCRTSPDRANADNSGCSYHTAVGSVQKQCGTDETDSHVSVPQHSTTITNEGTTGFVEVKTSNKHLKRIRTFFSRKYKSCRRSD